MAQRLIAVLTLLLCPSALAFNVTFAGSASIDYRYVWGPAPQQNPSVLGINGITTEVAQKVVADLGKGISFSAKACAGCHHIEVDHAYGEVTFHRSFSLRAGRLNVPFGEFTVRHDPVNFATPTRPLPYAMGDLLHYTRQGLNLGVVPAPWVDSGLEVFGSLPLGEEAQLDYTAWAVKGFAGENDFDFVGSRAWVDNNKSPSVGMRLVLNGADWAVGGSASAGTYDRRDQLWYYLFGADLYMRLGDVSLRLEGLARRTDLDRSLSYRFLLIDPWFLKVGWYGQLDWEVDPSVVLFFRSDGIIRFGMPLPESVDLIGTRTDVVRQTVGLMIRFERSVGIKAGYELWTQRGIDLPLRHVVRAAVVVGY